MSVSVFISCSGQTSSPPHLLGKNLQKVIQDTGLKGSAYFHGDRGNAGADWERAICDRIASAELFVPLIDENYFASQWCFLEYLLFLPRQRDLQARSGAPTITFILPVFLQRREKLLLDNPLDTWIDAVLHATAELCKHASLNNTPLADTPPSRADLLDWRQSMLVTAQALYTLPDSTKEPETYSHDLLLDVLSPLRKIFLDQVTTDALSKALATARASSLSSIQLIALRRASALASFCLRMDSFHDGGWGYSFGDLMDEDDDGNQLPYGLYETNHFVLGALTPFFRGGNRDLMEDEYRRTFTQSKPYEMQQRMPVDDRKPRIARVATFLSEHASFKAIAAKPFRDLDDISHSGHDLSRWYFGKPHSHELSDSVLLLELCARLRLCATGADLPAFLRTIDNFIASQDQPTHATSAQLLSHWTDWATEEERVQSESVGRLLKTETTFFRKDFSDNLKATSIQKGSFRTFYRDNLFRAYGFFFLSTFDSGLVLLRAWDQDVVLSYNSDYSNCTRGLKETALTVESTQADNQQRSAVTGHVYGLCSLYLLCQLRLHKTFSDGRNQELKQLLLAWINCTIRMSVTEHFGRLDSSALGAILLISKEAVRYLAPDNPDSHAHIGADSHIHQAWVAATGLVAARMERFTPEEVMNPLVHEKLRDLQRVALHDWWAAASASIDPEAAAGGTFPPDLSAASFLGFSFYRHSADVTPGRPKLGSLYVRRYEKRDAGGLTVHIADEGYNVMFIHPFSQMLNMQIRDMRMLRKVIGHSDEALVATVAKAVVDGCYSLSPGGAGAWEASDFETATAQAASALERTPLSQDSGFVHLLRCKAGYDEGRHCHRWILRTLAARRAYELKDEVFEIAVRFVDVSEFVDRNVLLVPSQGSA